MEPDELLDKLSGTMLAHAKEHGFVRCDTCLAEITPPARIGIYASNIDVERGERPLRANVAYCPDCRPTELRVPTLGVTEILFHADLVDEGGIPRIGDSEAATISKSDEGHDWNPGDVWERLTGIPAAAMSQSLAQQDSAVTPAHIEGVLYSVADIDLREHLESGHLAISNETETELQERVHTALMEMEPPNETR